MVQLKIMGSEIPINQFGTAIEADFNFMFLGKELLNGIQCHKVKVENSGYMVYPGEINVKNYKTGKSSNMKVSNVTYLNNVDIKDFKLSLKASSTN